MSSKQVDVLVIGSGIGGMCAAAYLAHKGYQVLVTEALPRIGGHCSTVEYQGIKCTTGVVGPGLGGPLEELFHEVGAEYNVRPCGTPHYLINGKIMELPEKGGMRALLSAATRDTEEVDRVLKAFSKSMHSTDLSETMSMREWLLQYTQDNGVLDLFQTMTGATAIVNIDSISARGFFLFLKQHRGFREWGVCPQGSIALPNALAKVIEKNNGEIWTGSPATWIHSEESIARGATLYKDGQEVKVEAAVVISNCGPKRTVDLAGKDNLGREYVANLEKLTPAKAISIHIKSDASLMDYDHLLIVGARRVVAIFQLTTVCPELAPPGTHYIVAGADPVGSLGPAEAKQEIDLSLQDLRDLLPEFESHAEILLTGVYHGGWPAMFSIAGQSMSPKTPIENLYAVGDGFITEPGMTAMVGAAASGVAAAKDITMRLKPRR
jgi:phytoene dehydrogenase-like protein